MLNDLRYAVRTLVKNPGFTVVAVITLALGIGANTAIFSVVNAVLLRPLPFSEPDRIVSVRTSTADEPRSNHSAGDFIDLRREQQSLQALAGYRVVPFTVASRTGEASLLVGAFVTAEFFDVLGVPAAIGRRFSGAEDTAAGERRVVLGRRAWKQLYGERAEAVGQPLRVNGQAHTLLGVLPLQAEWPAGADIWVLSEREVPPSPVDLPQEKADRDVRYFEAIARLKSGVTLAQAQQDVSRVATLLQARGAPTAARRDIRLFDLRENIVGDVRFGLLVLQAAVGLVLLIACANVSSLLIARASGRRRELAIRAALGAGRARLVRQLLTESVLLGITGGLVGLLVGAWMIGLLTRVLPNTVPRADAISLDRVVALVTILAALGTGVLFGVLPALQASHTQAQAALKRGGDRGGTSSVRTLGRSALVVAQVALTLVLLAGAGLLLNSLLRLQRVESGLQPENVTVAALVIPQSRYPTAASQIEVYRRLLEGVGARAGILAVGVGFPGPLRGGNASGTFTIEGRRTAHPSDQAFANLGSVSGGFFRAMGIPLVAGRTFADSDGAGAAPVAIASAAMARQYWPGENPIGKRLRFDDDPKAPWATVVGIVGDVRQLGLDQDAPPILYMPYQQFPLPFTNLSIRSTATAGAIASLIRAELAAIDPDLPPGDVRPLQAVLDGSIAQPRFRAMLLTAFALVALLLATVGVYGLVSYSVVQRTREIGIRMALGARPTQVLGQIMREGLLLAVAGVALGLLGALLAARVLATFLFGVGAADPLTFGAVALLLLAVACLATYVPSRRALQVDPVSALRGD
jgi:putative ABC transport system permease protein